MPQNNTNLKGIDPVILLSVIFVVIVLCLHHKSYTFDAFKILRKYQVTNLLQKFAVGGFLFLSGFKLAKSKINTSLVKFVKTRFYRIYCLYFLALSVFSFTAYPYSNKGAIPSLQNFILHALCLQSIFPNYFQKDYLTIWFVSVLFFCYIFFLLTRKFINNPVSFLILLISTFLFINIIRFLSNNYPVSIFVNYLDLWLVLFGIGMIYSKNNQILERFNTAWLLFLSIFCSTLLIMFYNQSEIIENSNFIHLLTDRILIILSVFPIYITIFKICPYAKVSHHVYNFIMYIYYSSFCTFLFHRPIWTIMKSFWREKTVYQFMYIVVIGVPTNFFVSYLIQKIYDLFITFILQKN